MSKWRMISVWVVLAAALSVVAGGVLGQDAAARPTAAKAYAASGVTVELYSDGVQQGRAGLVRVSGPALGEGALDVFERTVPLFAVPSDPTARYGMVAVDMDQTQRTYDMTVTVESNGQPVALLVPLTVRSGEFIRQDVILPENLLGLIAPEVESNEMMLLAALSEPMDRPPLWGGEGFQFPVQTELTSPFGAVRLFNETFETRHTGWDFRGGMGDIMRAAADGIVVYADRMDIRGGYVMIDHGYGVYSGYAHMSVMHAVPGQRVQKGQILGLAGNTGRSSDPHLHFEMRVHGEWIDPVDFITMWTPSTLGPR